MANRNKKTDYKKLITDTLRQKYPYFLVGVSLLIVLYLISVSFIPKNKLFQVKRKTPTPTVEKKPSAPGEKKYLVKEGDYLWRIAEEVYGSGYNAYDIALANKISNPNIITLGQELILPTVTSKPPTKGEITPAAASQKITLTETKYIVKKGDYLWKIALEAYGDGYAWVKIASANKLTNPDLIHPGNTLIIPR